MVIKKFFLSVILFLISNMLAYSQMVNDTCYKSFLKKYGIDGTFLEFKDVARTSDGGYIVSGFKGPLYYPIIIKLNSKGTVEWNKYFDLPRVARKVLQTNDGNFIVGTFSDKTQLTKLDNSGNVLWSKQYSSLNGYDLTFTDIQKANDGGFVIILNAAIGSGYTFNYIIKTDANGNIVWKKEILQSYSEPILKSLLVEGNQIYISSDSYTYYNRNQIDIARLELGTGNMVWTKTYEATAGILFDPHLALIGDTLVVSPTRNWSVNFNDTSTIAVITLDAKTGTKLTSYEFINPVVSFNTIYYAIDHIGPFHFNKTNDGNLFFAQLVYYKNDTLLNVTKFTTAGNTIWSKNFKNFNKNDAWSVKADGEELLIAGRHYTGYPNTTDIAFLIRLNRLGNVTDKTVSATEDCYNESVTPTIQALNINEALGVNLVSIIDGPTAAAIYYPMLASADVFTIESCVVVDSTCSTLLVAGPDSVCRKVDAVTFKAIRSIGCDNTVKWNFDTLFVKQLSHTDSSVIVSFIKDGRTTISASLQSSCNNLNIYKTIQVSPDASKLNLGPDLSKCFADTFKINATKGFKNYLWNDGSTDSTLTVFGPGSYHVIVEDFCGNLFRDTILISGSPFFSIDIGPDRQKCNNDTIHLNVSAGFINYSWGPNYNINSTVAKDVIVQPLVDTMYFIKGEKEPGCFAYDTVRIKVKNSMPLQLGADRSFCKGDSATLNAGNSFAQYQWSNGGSAQQIHVYATGIYSVIATTADGCKSYDTLNILNVWENPLVSLDHNPDLCTGTTRTLQAGNYASYIWQDGSTSSSFIARAVGTYYVTVTDSHQCKGADTVRIVRILPLPSGFLPADTAICSYEEVLLKANQTYSTYLWSNGNTGSAITIAQPGLYWLQATDVNSCMGKDSVVVLPKDCMKGVYVPTAFSPNLDGKNELFKPLVFGNVILFEWMVYNRYGQIIFSTNNPSRGWDGTIKGVSQNAGAFTWLCRYQFSGESVQVKKGSVLLLR